MFNNIGLANYSMTAARNLHRVGKYLMTYKAIRFARNLVNLRGESYAVSACKIIICSYELVGYFYTSSILS